MSAVVIPFGPGRPRQRSQGWRPDEIAEVYRVVDLLGRAGVLVSIDSGRTDEGEPWLTILRDDTEDVIVHIARIDERIIVASTASERVFSGPSLSETLRRVVGTEVLILPRGGGALYLHPAALLAALIATALTRASAGDATGADAGEPEQSRPSAVDAHLVSHAGAGQQHEDGSLRSPMSEGPPPILGRHDAPAYPMSVMASAVATVVLSVTPVGDEHPSKIERDFLDALRATPLVTVATQHPEDRPGGTDHADGNGGASFGGELIVANADTGDVQLEWAAGEGPVEVAEAGAALLRADLPHWLDLGAYPADAQQAHAQYAPSGIERAWQSASQEMWNTLACQETAEGAAPTLTSAAGVPAGLSTHSASVSAEPAPLRLAPTSSPDAGALHVADNAGSVVELSHQFFFWSGIKSLGVFKFDDFEVSGVADAHADRTHIFAQATVGGAAAPAGSLPEPAGPRAGGAVIPYEATAAEKALALSDFAYGRAHEVYAPPEILSSVRSRIASNSFLEAVDRVIIFDAPIANADSFMLMPGVAMIRSGVNYDVVLPLAVPAVEFALSDGSTLRLLGMIDI